ncbi:hypothetical protein B0H19DRAFT_1256957 [Mycena capillaripes]|nr:hypothetical protein B0H19DRAFT_1256957 [Mycena capillaripes]
MTDIKFDTVLITGTSIGGIGLETALAITTHANLVTIAGYSDERLKLAEAAIKKEVPTANIQRLILDLSCLSEVRKAAEVFNTNPWPLHVLIHNAAATIAPYKLTVDGLESQFATDHVGPFLFTKLVASKLLAAATAGYTPRVIFNPDPAKYDMSDGYYQAKSADILTAIEISKRSKGQINAYSLHPGIIFTNLAQKQEWREVAQSFGAWFKTPNSDPFSDTYDFSGLIDSEGRPGQDKPWKTLAQGGATTVAAAFDPRLNDNPGAYLEDCAVSSPAAHSSDPANADRLWNITEKIIGEPFTF